MSSNWRLNLNMARYLLSKRMRKEKRFPLVLMLEPLHACNLACSSCGRIREYRETLGEQMPLDACLGAAEECGAPVVSVCGGEPLLYSAIDELVDTLTTGMHRHVYLCTNGLLLDRFLERHPPNPWLNVNVHLDGLAETHDAIVGRKGVFEKVVSAIRLATSRGHRVQTNTTLFRETPDWEVEALFAYLEWLGVEGMLVAPGYHYEALAQSAGNGGDGSDEGAGANGPSPLTFLERREIEERFKRVYRNFGKFRFYSSPTYVKFLAGLKDLPCTPWGSVTRNPLGWKAPCYLITDAHYPTFREFMGAVAWDRYGPEKDPRCADCRMHCGFEPSAVLGLGENLGELWETVRWTLGR